MTKRYVHRDKNTGKYAVSHGSWISYTGTLAEAKIYRKKQGGKSSRQGDYEWVEVNLSTVEVLPTLQDDGDGGLSSERLMHTNIPVVEAYAFVQPWYDFEGPADISPSDLPNSQGLVVMAWCEKDQSWDVLEDFEPTQMAEAIRCAEGYDQTMRDNLSVTKGTEGTFFDHHVTIWEDTDGEPGAAIKIFDADRAELAAERKAPAGD